MTYFRYDNNKRGFDMAGIEWEIFDTPTTREFCMGGGRSTFVATVEIDQSGGKYSASITRSGVHVATLNEMDTARFIVIISFDGKDRQGRPRPWIKSYIETIEHFLGAGDRV